MTAFPFFPRICSAAAGAAALCAALYSPQASAACHVVYGPGNEIVYRSVDPPVDLSRPLHETLPRVAPGAALVFVPASTDCAPAINRLPLVRASAPTATKAPHKRSARRAPGRARHERSKAPAPGA